MIRLLLPSLFRIALSKSMPATRSPFNSVSWLAKVNIRHVVPFRSAPPWIALEPWVLNRSQRHPYSWVECWSWVETLLISIWKNHRSVIRQQDTWETLFIIIISLYCATVRKSHCVWIVDMICFVHHVEFWLGITIFNMFAKSPLWRWSRRSLCVLIVFFSGLLFRDCVKLTMVQK